MSLRADTITKAPGSPWPWRGLLREGGRAVYECTHDDHPARRAALECARGALNRLRSQQGGLPDGWVQSGKDTR